MLALSPAYHPEYSRFLAAMRNGGDSADALQKVYGKSISELEKDLIRYLHGGSFQAALFPLKLEKGPESTPTEAMAPMDVKLALVDLINRPGREDEVEQRLKALSTEDSQRPDPYVSLGYLSLRRQKREEAQKYFAKAFALGSQNTRMLWDYGRLIPGENRREAIRVLQRLLMEEPENLDVRLFLAGLQLADKRPQDALQSLNVVKKVNAEDAPRLFKMLAFSNSESGNTIEAQSAAQRWVDTARTASDRENALHFQNYLLDSRTGSKPATELSAVTANSLPEPSPPRSTRHDWPFATGSFVELKCDGSQATIVLKTTNGTRSFLIQDPTKIFVGGKGERTVDLNCGPQPGVPVRIDYEPAGTAGLALDGFVRAIHFTTEEK